MAFGNGPRIVTSGLVFAVDAADRNSYVSGSTTWFDLQNGRDHITLTNGPTFNSDNGGSIVFDGVDDYGSTEDVGGSYITISVWVYKTSTATNQGIITRRNASGWQIAQISSSLQVYLLPSIGVFQDTGYTIPLNEWTNIVYSYAGTGVNGSQVVYINGTSVFTAAGTGPLAGRARGTNFFVGVANGLYWGGRIAQVQAYNRALSSTEILQNYNNQKSRFNL
jgi:hypothetical protein